MRYDPRNSIDLTEDALLIRRLCEISESCRRGFDVQVNMLLALGAELFGLEIGVLSQISGDRYEVIEAISPAEVALTPGDRFDLASVFCRETMDARGVVGFVHASNEAPDHRCLRERGIEAYVGVPVAIDDEPFGTLCFASTTPRDGEFSPRDVEWLQLMGSWVGNELSRRRLIGRLERLSRTDPLTELLNRRGLEELLQRTRVRSKEPLAAILIDMDDFKSINEVYGLATGDEVLRLVANTLHRTVRADDPCARIGGDEFMVITRAEVAPAVAERIRVAIERLDPVCGGHRVPTSASVSAVALRGSASIPDLLRAAQRGLNAAKRQGKNRVVEDRSSPSVG